LDTARKAEILPYIERLRDDARLPILYVTHAMAEAARLASTLVVLGGGHVLHRGPAGVLLGDNAALRDMGQGGAASHLRAIVAGHTADGLTQLATAGGDVYVPRQQLPLGAQLQLGIAAADVMLSRTRPIGLSAQNILACTIDTVQPYDDSGVLVHLVMGQFAAGQFSAGQDRLIAHITRRAALDLGLGAGQAVFAIVKTTAIARQADAP
ncbi:MAG: TOBE domain-containing protein, partial [Cypionkella sp.]